MESGNKTSEYLSLVSGYLYRRMRYEARDLGIRWSALMVLKDLSMLGPVSQRALADIEQMSEPTMTVLLRQMQEKGWVKRQASTHDGRTKLVSLTAKGRRELASAGQYLRQEMDRCLAGLTAAQRKAIGEALEPLAGLIMQQISEGRESGNPDWSM